MKTNKDKRFTPQKNQDGNEVYCPLVPEHKAEAGADASSEDCVEKDVVERYSGNLDIKK